MVWNPFQCAVPTIQSGLENDAVLECDYEKNCTNLYKRIEVGEWDIIAIFLDTGYWPSHFYPDSMTPAEQARTWVTRMDVDGPPEQPPAQGNPALMGSDATLCSLVVPKIKWSQLPLHLAIVVDAPLGIVRRLVNLYPASIRCTDDEHMLPLHLALRHSAPDVIVDFLLQAFPEAVNARGKSNRTALECALRSRKKARARIIQIFIEQSTRTEPDVKSLSAVKDMLSEKDRELEDLQEHLIILEQEKITVEQDLEKKADELVKTRALLDKKEEELEEAKKGIELASSLNIDHYQTTRELQDLAEIQRIEMLEASKKELEESEKRIRDDEAVLRANLEAIEVCIARSFDKEDLDNLKGEVEALKARRLEHTRERLTAEMDMLKQTLQQNLENMEGKSKEEIMAMQAVLDQLSLTNFHDQSPEDLMTFQAELATLKDDLRRKREAGKTKSEIKILKRSLEGELKHSANKEVEDLEDLKEMVESLEESKLEKMSLEDLISVKENARALKKSVQSKEFVRETNRDLNEIQKSIDALLKTSEGATRSDLEAMKTVVEKMAGSGFEAKRKEDILSIRMEMAIMREELRQMEVVVKLKRELKVLQTELSMQIKKSSGKEKKELSDIKKSVEDMSRLPLEFKNYDDLMAMTNELKELKLASLKQKEVDLTKKKLEHMRAILSKQLRDSDGKSKATVLALKKELDQIQLLRNQVRKKPEKIEEVKQNMEALTFQMAKTEEEIATKAQLDEIKQQIDHALETAQGEMRHDLRIMKRTVASIDLDEIEVQATHEWTSLKTELQGLKVDLKRKEVKTIRQNLVARLQDQKQLTQMKSEELKAIQDAIDLLDVGYIDKAGAYELDGLKKDVEFTLECEGPERDESIKKAKKGLFGIFRGIKAKKSGQTKKISKNGKSLVPPRRLEESEPATPPHLVETISPPMGLTNKPVIDRSTDSSEPDSEDEHHEVVQEIERVKSTLSKGASPGGDGSGRPPRPPSKSNLNKNTKPSVPQVIHTSPSNLSIITTFESPEAPNQDVEVFPTPEMGVSAPTSPVVQANNRPSSPVKDIIIASPRGTVAHGNKLLAGGFQRAGGSFASNASIEVAQ